MPSPGLPSSQSMPAAYSPVPYRSDAPGAFKTIRTGVLGAGAIDYGANRLKKNPGGARISKESISAPSNFQSVLVEFCWFLRAELIRAGCRHILHASDADQAEELLMRWSAEGVGKVPSEFASFEASSSLEPSSFGSSSLQTPIGLLPSRERSKLERRSVKPSLSLKCKRRCIATRSSSSPLLLFSSLSCDPTFCRLLFTACSPTTNPFMSPMASLPPPTPAPFFQPRPSRPPTPLPLPSFPSLGPPDTTRMVAEDPRRRLPVGLSPLPRCGSRLSHLSSRGR